MKSFHSLVCSGKYFLQRTKKQALYARYNQNITMMESSELGDLGKQYRDRFASKKEMKYHTDIRKKNSICLNSYCRDYAVEQLLSKEDCDYPKMICINNPYGFAPLTALLLFRTAETYRVEYEVESRGKAKGFYGETMAAKRHRVPIIGLYPGMNKVVVRLFDEKGDLYEERRMLVGTKAVPENVKNMIIDKQFSNPSAYPFIFITGGIDVPFAFDNHCDIRYYLDMNTSTYGVFPLKNGHLLWPEGSIGVPTYAHAHTPQVHEIDYMGRIYKTFLVEKGMHHFATELPNGNIITVSNSLDGHTEDVVIELDRESGKVLRTINMVELFGDHYRDQVDWAHVNSIEYFPNDNTLMLCLRNVHSVIKFNYDTLEIVWVLSIPEFWEGTKLLNHVLEPIGEVEWNYQAHAAYELEPVQGQPGEIHRVLVFDNHHAKRRPWPLEDKRFSHIHVYDINEKEHTVKMVEDIPVTKSYVRSNARYDVKSNHMFGMLGSLGRKMENVRGRVVEIDCETKKVINSCYISKDFFSGYEFKPDCRDFEEKIPYTPDYMTGFLNPLSLTEETMQSIEAPILHDGVEDMYITEDILYFKAQDHNVERFYFVGEELTYVKDYTDTYQTNEMHKERSFYCMIPLKVLEKGSYKLMVQYLGNVYRLEKGIEVL